MDKLENESLLAFYKASEAIKENFTEKGLKALIKAYSETSQEDLIRDGENALPALAGLPLEFYDNIAESVYDHMNNFPEYWLMYDTRNGVLFDQETSSYIVNKIFEKYPGTNSEYVYKGILALNNESYDLAMVYFNQSDHYIINYYKGLCYLGLKSHSNAIKNFEIFLKGINNYFATSEIPKEDFDPSENFSLKRYRWELFDFLLYLYNETKQYDLAIHSFNEAVKIFSLKYYYKYNLPPLEERSELADFEPFINNYLFALEKTGKYRKAVDFLQNELDFLSDKPFYQNRLKDYKARIERHEFADEILKNVVRVRRPFNIEAFTKTQSIAREKVLEDMILEQIKYGFEVFGKKLELYQDATIHGRQYYVRGANGFLDLLLIDKESDDLYVVELKRGLAGVEVIEQIEKYMEALSIEMNKPLKGIICLHQANPQLTKLVKSKKDIELFTYHFDFNRLG